MNNNLINQLVHFLTHGWQNPLPGMGQAMKQGEQNLYDTYWKQTPPNMSKLQGLQTLPMPTPNNVVGNGQWKVYGQLPNQKQQTTRSTQPPQMPQQQQVMGVATQPQQQSDAAIFQSMGINPQVGMAILQAEGGRIGQNNPGNVGAFDSHPTGAYNYPTRQAGVRAAAQTMKAIINQAGVNSNDPNQQLGALEKHYAGDPKTWKQRSMATGGAGKYFNSWSDFVKSTPTWKQYGGGQ